MFNMTRKNIFAKIKKQKFLEFNFKTVFHYQKKKYLDQTNLKIMQRINRRYFQKKTESKNIDFLKNIQKINFVIPRIGIFFGFYFPYKSMEIMFFSWINDMSIIEEKIFLSVNNDMSLIWKLPV